VLAPEFVPSNASVMTKKLTPLTSVPLSPKAELSSWMVSVPKPKSDIESLALSVESEDSLA
jgi:hypothetical protein